MNRSDAKMIAEELHKFIRNDVRKAVTANLIQSNT